MEINIIKEKGSASIIRREQRIRKHENEMRDEFSLNQKEVHDYGTQVLSRLQHNYENLIDEPDWCESIDSDLRLLSKLSTIVVRLQLGRKLKEETTTKVE